MDSASVISLSSTSSKTSIVTISSERQRVPVSWDNDEPKKKKKIADLEATPDHSEKVQVWIESCKNDHQTQSTCLRYDFEKGAKVPPQAPKSCYTLATPLFTYMEKAKKMGLKNDKPNGKSDFCPLSPESHKKELCKYLQLMKPDDSSQGFFVEYRRSGRVKAQNGDEKGQNPTLKSFSDLNLKLNKWLPLPPKSVYENVTHFDDSVKEFMEEPPLRKIEKRRKFKFRLRQKFKQGRLHSLRSKGYLRNISLDKLIIRKKARKKVAVKPPPEKVPSPRCEIVSVHFSSDDENIDLKNFVDDMLELDKMSEEHRKSVIESRILASSSITNLISKRTNQEDDVQRAYRIFSDLSNERKNPDEKENTQESKPKNVTNERNQSPYDQNENLKNPPAEDSPPPDHNYASLTDDQSEEEEPLTVVPIPNIQVLPVRKEIQVRSLHRSLTHTRRKNFINNYLHNWSNSNSTNRKSNHSIRISSKNGKVLRAFYQDYNLVITQENLVSFWTQSALGNVLGAQNMWIPKWQVQRIALNSTYVQKDAMEMVITTETSVAYVELWTKEHKSDLREVPVADVFATVYFWRLRQTGLDKKALQLENIKGFADDVQYCVLKSYPRIVVSWNSVQGGEKRTKIHSYHLAADFQTVANISEIQPVEHYVASLHNIEDCDSLVMGCGENKITLWNVEYGYVVATIEMSSIKSPLSTHWVKCDRGFLFTIQECVDQELTLIAINGMNHSWKKLQSYIPTPGFDRLKGVCVENGILVAYYSQGILCWNAQTGELIVEDVPNECEYIPGGKHVIMIVNENIIVRHSLSHLITDY